LYDRKYRAAQGGRVSITLSSEWAEPKNPDDPNDVEAADRFLQVMQFVFLQFVLLPTLNTLLGPAFMLLSSLLF